MSTAPEQAAPDQASPIPDIREPVPGTVLNPAAIAQAQRLNASNPAPAATTPPLYASSARQQQSTTVSPAFGRGDPAGGDDWGIAGLGKTALGLIVVLGLILLCSVVIRRLGAGRLSGGQQKLKVIASQSIGQRERVVMVEVEETWLVLGVAPGNVRTLHTLPARRDEAAPAASTPPGLGESFKRVLAQRFERGDRRH